MDYPEKVLDLHTHMFNARYLPLEGIIAHAMGKKTSKLARGVAKLVVYLTGSSYKSERKNVKIFKSEAKKNDFFLSELWAITEYELLLTAQSTNLDMNTLSGDKLSILSNPDLDRITRSSLVEIINELANIDYAKEGFIDGKSSLAAINIKNVKNPKKLFGFAKKIVMQAFRAISALMDPYAWGKAENYLEFLYTMIKSERSTAKKVLRSYKSKKYGNIEVLHMMMDMHKAYNGSMSPAYDFFPAQISRMQQLQRDFPGNILGMSAFDPRRKNWQEIADHSIASGLLGFKFYPAMEYKPSGNKDPVIQDRIDKFFDYCVSQDIPIFTHCTPFGFQTINKLGHYAHPKYWEKVLEDKRWEKLRICFGHAGGADYKNKSGWMASTDKEWQGPDNYAYRVALLCTTFKNVYCEFGYFTDLIEGPAKTRKSSRELIVKNMHRAINLPNTKHAFMDKVAYGSDWHMPSMVDNTRKYLDAFLQLINDEFPENLESFFWMTGNKFLKRSS